MKIPYPCDVVLFKRWLKFNAVGAMGTCVQLLAVYLLGFLLRVDSMVSTALGVEAAILHNFIWHQHFTWFDRPPFRAKDVLRRFFGFNATTGAISIAGNLLLVSLVMREVHAPLLAANLLAIAACSLGNFAVSETMIFRATGGSGLQPVAPNSPPLAVHEPLFTIPFRRENFETMSLIDRIQKDLTAAMKEKNELRLSVLRLVKSALKNKEIEKMRPLENLEALQVLQTLVKQRRESIEQFTKGGRDDLAEKESREITIIENYLPAAPSDAEITRAIEDAIAKTGADSIKQMGAVIKAARAKLEGKTVDGKVLSDKVRDRLS